LKPPYAAAAARVADARRTLAETYAELAEIAETVDDPAQRGNLNALLWECAAGQPSRDRYFSQYGQDAYLDSHVFGGRHGGVFVEVGGFDGVTGSNCLFFEIFRGWTGVMIEAVEEHIEAAREFRNCNCIQALVGTGEPAEFLTIDGGPIQMSGLTGSYDPRRREWVDAQPQTCLRTEVRPTQLLGDVLQAQGIAKVDLLCIDIEGAEESVLAGFPFDDIEVACLCIETVDKRDPVLGILQARGYQWVDRIGYDDLFVSPDLA
jgi:FkbM family methyltransferase